MKTKMYVMFSLFILPFLMLAQTDSLSVRSSFWTGTSIQNNGRNISFYQAKEIVKANTASFEAIKKAESNANWSIAFQVAGGLGMGYTLGSFLSSENASEVEWWQGAVGLGVAIIGLHFESKAKQNAQKGVDLFNENPPPTTSSFQPQFQFGLGLNGVGIGMRF
jgi:uncharacterized membrane protein YfcA